MHATLFVKSEVTGMIRNIVFDMGNVLIPFDPAAMMELAHVPEEDLVRFRQEVFETQEWAALDRAIIEEKEAIRHICARLPARLHPAVNRVFAHMHEEAQPFTDMYGLIRDCRAAGCRTYLLSNTSKRFYSYMQRIPAIALMDGIFVSCDVRRLKPDPVIYQLFFEKFRLAPESCFFVDDAPINVEAAAYCGMRGFIYRRDTERLRDALRQAGVGV